VRKITDWFVSGPSSHADLLPTTPVLLGVKVRSSFVPKVVPNPTKIPSTRKWTTTELDFFKLHYFQVRYDWWEQLICPKQNCSTDAHAILASGIGLSGFLDGRHTEGELVTALNIFGDCIVNTRTGDAVEASSDSLAQILLHLCNTQRATIMPTPQTKVFRVDVGGLTFKSIPDASAIIRKSRISVPTPIFIVVEDKKQGAGFAEYQLPGEMLAAAYRNYFECKIAGDQTVFAMRVIASSVTFYRAEFSKNYLLSVKTGVPNTPVTVFRFGGGTNSAGLDVSEPLLGRGLAFTVLCSIFELCCSELLPHWSVSKSAPLSSARLAELNQE